MEWSEGQAVEGAPLRGVIPVADAVVGFLRRREGVGVNGEDTGFTPFRSGA